MVTIANEMESLTAMFEEADDLNGRRKQEEERAAGGKVPSHYQTTRNI